LEGLENLQLVKEWFIIKNNNGLSSLAGLEKLASVGSNITIEYNPVLSSLEGFAKLDSVKGNFRIYKNDKLSSLTGLRNLVAVGKELQIIANDGLSDLAGLEKLTSVGGQFIIGFNSNLSSLAGLDNLTSVESVFSIRENYRLSSLEGLKKLELVGGLEILLNKLSSLAGLGKITSVGGGIMISGNMYMNTLAGLENLVSVGQELKIDYNYKLTSLAGLGKLTSVGDNIFIGNNDSLRTLARLDSLSWVGKTVQIENNYKLTSLRGLDALKTVGSVFVKNNPSLTSLAGLNNVDSVRQSIHIYGNPKLSSLVGLGNLTYVGKELQINSNLMLSTLAGLDSLARVEGIIEIINNPQLSQCCLLLPFLQNPKGTVTIGENAMGCQGQLSIEEACAPVIPPIFTEKTDANLTGVNNASAAWGDYDNDGDLDILLTGTAYNSNSSSTIITKIYRNNAGIFEEVTNTNLPGVTAGSAAWGDYDNDGDLDILLSGYSSNGPITKVYKNTAGSFAELTGSKLTGVELGSVAWGDYDNDGDLDILIAGITASDNYITKIYRNVDGNFEELTAANLTGVSQGSAAWGDYDNDGDLDIMITGDSNGSYITKIYRNNAGIFEEVTNTNLTGVQFGSVAWGDYDNDGDLDILLSGSLGSSYITKIYQNDAGNFTELQDTNLVGVGRHWGKAAWGDYDNDGDLDILLSGQISSESTRKLIIYRNDEGSFIEVTGFNLMGANNGSAAWGDYDNDGDLDILITGNSTGFSSSGITKIYQNNTDIKNDPPSAPANLKAVVSGQQVTLSWDAATDAQTPADGLSYNVYVGTSANKMKLVSPQANLQTGYRQIPALGNGQTDTTFLLNNFPSGTYYWSVQAIDGAFAGSEFAPEGSFTLNTKPVAEADAYGVNEDKVLTIAVDLGVLHNDTDADKNTLAAEVVPDSNEKHGTLKLGSDGSFTYKPAANYNGTDAFTYQVSDGQGGTATATVTFTVHAVNDAPSFAKGASQEVAENAGAQTVSGWATAVTAGPEDESEQKLSFSVSNSNSDLFSAQPAISLDGTLTYTPAADAFGVATLEVSLKDNGGTENGGIDKSDVQSFTITVKAVNDAPVVTTNKATQQVQYSDPVTAVTIKATDADNSYTTLSASTSWKVDNGAFISGLPASLTLSSPTGAGNIRTWSLSGNMQVAPGTYTIRVSVNDGTGEAANNSGYTDVVIIVTPEDAVADYTGAQSVATASATSGTALLTLNATLRDITAVTSNPLTDAAAGDIQKAKVRFLLDNTPVVNTNSTNGAITDAQGWTSVSLVNATDTKTGTVLVKAPVNIGTADAQQYTIRVEVSGYYTAEEETQVLNVYKPLNDFVTGGGYLVPTKSSGAYASDAGRKTNFGFNVKYNKSGKSLQGNINAIFRRKEKDGLVHVYQIKGNSMTSLSVNAKVATAKTAIFNGKATLQDITNPTVPISLGGNLTLQVSMTDKGEPGKNDLLGITVFSSTGGILYASNWDGVKTAEMLLSGGNIIINSGSVTTTISPTTAAKTAVNPGATEVFTAIQPTLTAYPNPVIDQATIEFSFAQDEAYMLTVYDLKGTLVKQLPGGKAKANEQKQVAWQVGNAAAGLYIVRLTTANTVQQLKLMVE